MSQTLGLLNFDRYLASTVADPALRKQLAEACQALPFDSKVLKVKEFRDDFRDARLRAQQGGIVVVAERGTVEDPRDATLLISLETFERVLTDAIEKASKAARKRGRLADLLVGLPAVPAAAAHFEVDFDALAKIEGQTSGSDIEL